MGRYGRYAIFREGGTFSPARSSAVRLRRPRKAFLRRRGLEILRSAWIGLLPGRMAPGKSVRRIPFSLGRVNIGAYQKGRGSG